ncbi:MAG: 2-oxo acid dehydrogenase subunit E2, partial [Thermoleophilia bacterium]|nr:2-oxo acid dehydrogenase subunit E2 [Thermoleophilia bacterium]
SVSEGTISTWLKAVGDTIEKDETLLEISTDKVDTEVPSPGTGIVTAPLDEEGETVDVGVKLAEIAVGGEGAAAPAAEAPAPATPPAPAAAVPAPVAPPVAAPVAAPAATAPAVGSVPGRFVSPVVASIAAEQGIDPSLVPGTGSGGRVTKKDILAYLAGGAPAAAAPAMPAAAAPAPIAAPAATLAPAPVAPAAAPAVAAPQPFVGGETIVPFNPMRKAIARHMVESVHTSPHVTSTMEVDMTRVVNLRNRVKNDMAQQWGVKVTFTHFVIRALIDAIAHFPLINSEIRGESAVVKSYVNLGIAVALDAGQGLIVPVLQHAEEKNLVGIARGVSDIATRARTKKLRPDDVSGGTFTLTNPGIFGAVHGTPIINQPQVAIIDTEAIVKRAVVVTDADGADSIAIRSMMNLCLSYDHRIIDGAYAVQFLAHLRRSLETWDEAAFIG